LAGAVHKINLEIILVYKFAPAVLSKEVCHGKDGGEKGREGGTSDLESHHARTSHYVCSPEQSEVHFEKFA